MECYRIVIGVVLVLQAHYSHEACLVVQSPAGLQKYWCNTVQELERNGDPQLFDVDIYNGTTFPAFSNATQQRTPALRVMFADYATDGLSAATFQIVKDLSDKIGRNYQTKTIPKGVFENLPAQSLHLNDNGVESIQIGAFSKLDHLTELGITHNNLKTVETGIFNNLPVQTLDLSHNKIAVIKRNALYNMKNLKNLHLNGNSLTEFLPDTFLSFGTELETLHLQHNSLTVWNREAVRTLNNLRVLKLGNNRITKIGIYTFEDLLKLEELVLSNNLLQDLDENAFAVKGAPKLAKLLLNDNTLSYLTPKLLGKLPSLKSISIRGNPWECRCLDDIAKWSKDNKVDRVCESDYTSTKPICVVLEIESRSCDYSVKTSQFFKKYEETHTATALHSECAI